MSRADAANTFGLLDFKEVHVATYSGNLTPSGTPFASAFFFNPDGQGGVTGSWEGQVADTGTTFGGTFASTSTYTVSLEGRVAGVRSSAIRSKLVTGRAPGCSMAA